MSRKPWPGRVLSKAEVDRLPKWDYDEDERSPYVGARMKIWKANGTAVRPDARTQDDDR